MKKAVFLAAAILFPGMASAADMAVKARPLPPAPTMTWTGFYAGLNAGYGWGDASNSNSPVDPASQALFGVFGPADFNTSFRKRGAIAGGQVGYNWQFTARGVLGLEADLQWSDINGSGFRSAPLLIAPTILYETSTEQRLRWFGTVRGRLGFLVTPSLLLYGTGGLAYGETESRGNIRINNLGGGAVIVIAIAPPFSAVCTFPGPPCYAGSSSETHVGWTAGAGGEWKIAPNWSVKAEYLRVALQGSSATLVSPAPPSTPGVSTIFRFNTQNYDIVRVGVNYQFSGPVVAKY